MVRVSLLHKSCLVGYSGYQGGPFPSKMPIPQLGEWSLNSSRNRQNAFTYLEENLKVRTLQGEVTYWSKFASRCE